MHLHLLDPKGGVETPSLKGEDFNDPEGSSRCKCIRKPCLIDIIAILSLENFGKTLQKVRFCITIMARKSMKDSYVLKTPVPEQQLTSVQRH